MAVCNSQRECYKQALNIQNMAKDDSLYSPNLFPLTGTSQILNVTVAVIIYKLMSLVSKIFSLYRELQSLKSLSNPRSRK